MNTALKEAKKRNVPLVIVLDIPDSEIPGDVRELTGDKGKIIFLSLTRDGKEALEIKHRYDLAKPGAVLTDEFGNLLKGKMKNPGEIADAFYAIDELMAESFQTWSHAIKQGEALIKKGQYSEAAKVLKIFAFAAGTDEAEKGRKLFKEVAMAASKEYEQLAHGAESVDMDDKSREALLTRLSAFMEKWPKTPAAFAAEARIAELASEKGS